MILTDGEIHDMQQTVDLIVSAADLPISIIIIGVGESSFKNMETLDGDKGGLISSTGKKSTRDIVQFVEYKKYAANPATLASQVLAEIPDQLVNYMTQNSIAPSQAPVINREAH